ncbi:transcriptional repressor general negative regulator of transcription subunit 4 [Nowakowskiella sp. JEL0407]|nr:transcriptional repressor general negative regulator of transcription subunit 4 [Nowakowskiella sp. JEL0407]
MSKLETMTEEKDTTYKPLKLSEIFVKKLTVDETDGKSQNIQLFSLRRPHMLSFHLSWLGFFTAFTGWFALSPLLKLTIVPDLKLSPTDVPNSNISNVSSTVIFRFFIGPLVDKLGPSRLMALLLTLGAIPLAFTGLMSSGAGLITVRAFIGILGATFVPCQYWTTAMFSKRVVGTANAIVGGWGNMGAGATNLLMPQLYAMFKAFGLSNGVAWRVCLLVPALLCLIVASLCWFYGEDKPPADLITRGPLEIVDDESKLIPEKGGSEGHTHIVGGGAEAQKHPIYYIMFKCLIDPNIIILAIGYACCFGVELSVDSVIGDYFIKTFGVNQQIGGLFGALFGLMNIFSRASGGIISDFCAAKMGLRGRYLWSIGLFAVSAASIIWFSFANDMNSAIIAMVIFSYCCQAGCGATFGIVPFVGEYMGTASGLIGAGGNIGGALFNVVFSIYLKDPATAFRIMGIVVAVAGAGLSLLLNVQGENLFFKKKEAMEKVPTEEPEEGNNTTVKMESDTISHSSNEDLECPLCMEEIDITDKYFKPCPCGYQICRFCWNHIKENLNGLCPACRRPYSEETLEFVPVTTEELFNIRARKKRKERERKEQEVAARKHLANVRVVQRNLVYVIGLPAKVSSEEILRTQDYFGQYGKIIRIVVNRRGNTSGTDTNLNGVYVTFARKEDATKCIEAVDGSLYDGKVIRASCGTTKYCSLFLRNQSCGNPNCQYLHEVGEEADGHGTIGKDDLILPKESTPKQTPFPIPSSKKDGKEESMLPPTANWAKQGKIGTPVMSSPRSFIGQLRSTTPEPDRGSDIDMPPLTRAKPAEVVQESPSKKKKKQKSLPDFSPIARTLSTTPSILNDELISEKLEEDSISVNGPERRDSHDSPFETPNVEMDKTVRPPTTIARSRSLSNDSIDFSPTYNMLKNYGFDLFPNYSGSFDPFETNIYELILKKEEDHSNDPVPEDRQLNATSSTSADYLNANDLILNSAEIEKIEQTPGYVSEPSPQLAGEWNSKMEAQNPFGFNSNIPIMNSTFGLNSSYFNPLPPASNLQPDFQNFPLSGDVLNPQLQQDILQQTGAQKLIQQGVIGPLPEQQLVLPHIQQLQPYPFAGFLQNDFGSQFLNTGQLSGFTSQQSLADFPESLVLSQLASVGSIVPAPGFESRAKPIAFENSMQAGGISIAGSQQQFLSDWSGMPIGQDSMLPPPGFQNTIITDTMSYDQSSLSDWTFQTSTLSPAPGLPLGWSPHSSDAPLYTPQPAIPRNLVFAPSDVNEFNFLLGLPQKEIKENVTSLERLPGYSCSDVASSMEFVTRRRSQQLYIVRKTGIDPTMAPSEQESWPMLQFSSKKKNAGSGKRLVVHKAPEDKRTREQWISKGIWITLMRKFGEKQIETIPVSVVVAKAQSQIHQQSEDQQIRFETGSNSSGKVSESQQFDRNEKREAERQRRALAAAAKEKELQEKIQQEKERLEREKMEKKEKDRQKQLAKEARAAIAKEKALKLKKEAKERKELQEAKEAELAALAQRTVRVQRKNEDAKTAAPNAPEIDASAKEIDITGEVFTEKEVDDDLGVEPERKDSDKLKEAQWKPTVPESTWSLADSPRLQKKKKNHNVLPEKLQESTKRAAVNSKIKATQASSDPINAAQVTSESMKAEQVASKPQGNNASTSNTTPKVIEEPETPKPTSTPVDKNSESQTTEKLASKPTDNSEKLTTPKKPAEQLKEEKDQNLKTQAASAPEKPNSVAPKATETVTSKSNVKSIKVAPTSKTSKSTNPPPSQPTKPYSDAPLINTGNQTDVKKSTKQFIGKIQVSAAPLKHASNLVLNDSAPGRVMSSLAEVSKKVMLASIKATNLSISGPGMSAQSLSSSIRTTTKRSKTEIAESNQRGKVVEDFEGTRKHDDVGLENLSLFVSTLQNYVFTMANTIDTMLKTTPGPVTGFERALASINDTAMVLLEGLNHSEKAQSYEGWKQYQESLQMSDDEDDDSFEEVEADEKETATKSGENDDGNRVDEANQSVSSKIPEVFKQAVQIAKPSPTPTTTNSEPSAPHLGKILSNIANSPAKASSSRLVKVKKPKSKLAGQRKSQVINKLANRSQQISSQMLSAAANSANLTSTAISQIPSGPHFDVIKDKMDARNMSAVAVAAMSEIVGISYSNPNNSDTIRAVVEDVRRRIQAIHFKVQQSLLKMRFSYENAKKKAVEPPPPKAQPSKRISNETSSVKSKQPPKNAIEAPAKSQQPSKITVELSAKAQHSKSTIDSSTNPPQSKKASETASKTQQPQKPLPQTTTISEAPKAQQSTIKEAPKSSQPSKSTTEVPQKPHQLSKNTNEPSKVINEPPSKATSKSVRDPSPKSLQQSRMSDKLASLLSESSNRSSSKSKIDSDHITSGDDSDEDPDFVNEFYGQMEGFEKELIYQLQQSIKSGDSTPMLGGLLIKSSEVKVTSSASKSNSSDGRNRKAKSKKSGKGSGDVIRAGIASVTIKGLSDKSGLGFEVDDQGNAVLSADFAKKLSPEEMTSILNDAASAVFEAGIDGNGGEKDGFNSGMMAGVIADLGMMNNASPQLVMSNLGLLSWDKIKLRLSDQGKKKGKSSGDNSKASNSNARSHAQTTHASISVSAKATTSSKAYVTKSVTRLKKTLAPDEMENREERISRIEERNMIWKRQLAGIFGKKPNETQAMKKVEISGPEKAKLDQFLMESRYVGEEVEDDDEENDGATDEEDYEYEDGEDYEDFDDDDDYQDESEEDGDEYEVGNFQYDGRKEAAVML